MINIKNIIKSFIVAVIAISIVLLITLLLLNNLNDIVKLFNNSGYIDVFFEKLNKCDRNLPILMLIFVFLMEFFITFLLLSKNKIICIILNVLICLIGVVVVCLLTTYDGTFLFQIIQNIKESING